MCLKRRENNFATSEIEPDNDRRAALRWMGIMEKKEQLNWQQLSRSRMVPAISREQCPGFKKKERGKRYASCQKKKEWVMEFVALYCETHLIIAVWGSTMDYSVARLGRPRFAILFCFVLACDEKTRSWLALVGGIPLCWLRVFRRNFPPVLARFSTTEASFRKVFYLSIVTVQRSGNFFL